MAWKNYSFEAIEQLDKQDLIVDPQGRYRSKYAYITEKGRQKARKLLAEMGIETGDLYDRFDFREIHQDEVEQAAEISACAHRVSPARFAAVSVRCTRGAEILSLIRGS